MTYIHTEYSLRSADARNDIYIACADGIDVTEEWFYYEFVGISTACEI